MKSEANFEDFIESIKNAGANPDCPVMRSLELLQGKWTSRVIFHLLRQDVLRFGELKKAIPDITNTMLAATLKELEQKGVVSRTQYNEIPPHVEYSLTKSGNALMPVFYELGKWGKNYMPKKL